MRLTFSVLWFDDREDYFDSLNLEPLENEVYSWGFEPDIKKVITPENFAHFSPFQQFDLIIVDQNLENYPDGQEFIADLRKNAIYTEVIFYTAGNVSALWDAIQNKQLEGVFVSSKNGILEKIMSVGRQSIRKVLDLENMRGIVMAEVGELDHLLDQIIIAGMGGVSEEQRQSIFKKFHEGSIEQQTKDITRLNAFFDSPKVDEMLVFCDSNKRWQNFNRLWKCHPKLQSRERVGDYVKDILKLRNFLAHGKPTLNPEGGYTFTYKEEKFLYTNESSAELRKTILQYKKNFCDILKAISSSE